MTLKAIAPVVLVVLVTACTFQPIATSYPAPPTDVTPPLATPPQSLQGQSFLTDLFGYPDMTGVWGGIISNRNPEPMQLRLAYGATPDNWLQWVRTGYYVPLTSWWSSADFFWFMFKDASGYYWAVVGITDNGHRRTQSCGLYLWDFFARIWDFPTPAG